MAENELYKAALSRAMALCSQREYCCEDIRVKLATWGAGERDAEKIIADLIKENFINERRYAEAFVKDKFRYNKWGKIKIRSNLRIKKIPPEIINSALDSIDKDLYRKTIEDLLLIHRRSIRGKNQYDIKGKLLRYGLSKGFEGDLLYDILSDFE